MTLMSVVTSIPRLQDRTGKQTDDTVLDEEKCCIRQTLDWMMEELHYKLLQDWEGGEKCG